MTEIEDLAKDLFKKTKPEDEFWTWETLPEKRKQAHRDAVITLLRVGKEIP